MLSDRTLDFGRQITTALLGVDRLYRAESGDGDGLAVLNMDTAGEFAPDPFPSYRDANARFDELRADAAALPEPDRRVYYDELCRSTLAFIAWRDGGLPFAAQLSRFLHVPAEPVGDTELVRLRDEIGERLDAGGYRGTLEARCGAWEERNRLEPDDIAEVLTGLLSRAWDRTEEVLVAIPASKSDGMRVRTVTGAAYNARCDYPAREIEINTDPILTRPALKHLAVHEGYPGHYLQFKLRETGYRAGTAAADGLLSVVNTASSSVFEGIADTGIEMLGWIENDDDRIHAALNRYRAAIGTGAAWRLHALGAPPADVADWLRARSLTGGEGWIRNRLRFIAAPPRAALIWSYWWGEPVVASAWRNVPESRRAEFLSFLYGRMHSNTSVGMFQ